MTTLDKLGHNPMDALVEAAQRLSDATAGYKHAQELARDARNKETQRQNELIQAQKDFDTAVANVKKEAPYGGEWSTKV